MSKLDQGFSDHRFCGDLILALEVEVISYSVEALCLLHPTGGIVSASSSSYVLWSGGVLAYSKLLCDYRDRTGDANQNTPDTRKQ